MMIDPFNNEHFRYFDNASDAWESKSRKKELCDAYAEWILSAKKWSEFLTLTFKDDVPIDTAKRKFNYLLSALNTECFGKHYTRIVEHCYFSYVLATEPQKRDVIHFHALADRPIHYALIHRFWNAWAGFGWTEEIKDEFRSVKYVSKYVSKGGELDVYFAKKQYTPIALPAWWKEKDETEEIVQGFNS